MCKIKLSSKGNLLLKFSGRTFNQTQLLPVFLLTFHLLVAVAAIATAEDNPAPYHDCIVQDFVSGSTIWTRQNPGCYLTHPFPRSGNRQHAKLPGHLELRWPGNHVFLGRTPHWRSFQHLVRFNRPIRVVLWAVGYIGQRCLLD
jgi:hypothetical protein